MFRWNEIKAWANANGYAISKTAGKEEYFFDGERYTTLRPLVKDVWNRMTDNKWVEYQKTYVPPRERYVQLS